jgi:hyperosmotically inducible protein
MQRIAASLLLVLSVWLGGCASLVATGVATPSVDDGRTRAEMRADADVTNRINDAFVRDASVPAMNIRVFTYRGTVTLSGRVPSRSVVHRALAIVRGTPGVRSVRNRLTY